MKDVLLYATDGMADWEYGYVVAGLAMADAEMPGGYRLRVAASSREPIHTMGGLTVVPDISLVDVSVPELAMVVLPGADTWEEAHDEVLELTKNAVQQGVPVAAICGATLGLARAGVLNDRRHTSNAADFLAASGYTGAAGYVEAKTVTDQGVITAPATAPVDFARAVFETLDLFPEPVLDAWYGLYTTGERRFYDQLVGA